MYVRYVYRLAFRDIIRGGLWISKVKCIICFLGRRTVFDRGFGAEVRIGY